MDDVHRFIQASSLAYVLLVLIPLSALCDHQLSLSRCLEYRVFGQYQRVPPEPDDLVK